MFSKLISTLLVTILMFSSIFAACDVHTVTLRDEFPHNGMKSSANPSNGLIESGLHMATNEMVTANKLNVSLSDWDGDNIDNQNDTYPHNPSTTGMESVRASNCQLGDQSCTYDFLSLISNSPTESIQTSESVVFLMGDVDNNGWADLVIAKQGRNEIYLNHNGNIGNTPNWQSSTRTDTRDLALADLNQDGQLDLIFINYNADDEIYINSNGTFPILPSWKSTGYHNEGLSIAVGDVNGDSYVDVVIGIRNSPPELYLNTGSGLPNMPTMQITSSGNNSTIDTSDVALGDYDQDGDLDLAVAESGGLNLIFENQGNSFTLVWTGHILDQTNSVLWRDFDRDGDLDLAFGNAGSFNHIYENINGEIIDFPTWSSSSTVNTRYIDSADINNDGYYDLISVNTNEDTEIFINKNGNFSDKPDKLIELPVGSASRHSKFSDFDGDGDTDLIIGYHNRIDFHIGMGYSLNQAHDYLVGNATGYGDVEMSDVDSDGDLDLIFGRGDNNPAPNHLYLYENNSFPTTPSWTSGTSMVTRAIDLGDIDGDGDLDLLVGNMAQENELFINNNGSFDTNPFWTSSNSAMTKDIKLSDIDGDMDLDMIVGNRIIGPEIYLNIGGNFSSSASWTGTYPCDTTSIKTSDFNEDGKTDLLETCGYNLPVIHWGLQDQASNYTVLNSNQSQDAKTHDSFLGDFDNDGDLDIALAASDGCGIMINNGGAFSNSSHYFSPPRASLANNQVALVDFNGDGKLDLSCQNSVFIQNSSTFMLTILWEPTQDLDPWSRSFGDINQDGTLDYVIANAGYPAQIFMSEKDSDKDWVPDARDDMDANPTQSSDFDGDGYGDSLVGTLPDSCQGVWGDSWRDRFGCTDEDGDGQSNLNDDFWTKSTQWLDSDGDGFGDNWADNNWTTSRPSHWPGEWVNNAFNPDQSPLDYDNDGFEDQRFPAARSPYDGCDFVFGTSHIDRMGCRDSDSDGRSDISSDWTQDDGGDRFPTDSTQWLDSDGDGYGDEPFPATNPDMCPNIFGESTKDGLGCPDLDLDGYGLTDSCPNEFGNSTQDSMGCIDTDGDGYSDSSDIMVNNSEIWSDGDSDGYFDQGVTDTLDSCIEQYGTSQFDRLGCLDTDGDGWSNSGISWLAHPLGIADSHPLDSSQNRDRDGDGYGDNQTGSNPDSCPDQNGKSRWSVEGGFKVIRFGCMDSDLDGFEDLVDNCANVPGTSEGDFWGCPDSDSDGIKDSDDSCPSVFGTSKARLVGCQDSDGDGIADVEDPHPLEVLIGESTKDDWDGDGTSNEMDLFPFEQTQYADLDNDGLGDNTTGVNPDPSPNDFDNDGYFDPENQDVDDLGCLVNPEQGKDFFPRDPTEWVDSDNDCVGDNKDSDDDNDGYTDIQELQRGTDPLSNNSKPIEGFEVIIPGTEISLGAWDLIGMFGGIPLFAWIGFGFVTRNRRTAKFATRLRESNTRDELEEVAKQWEYSLMLRLLGPHQGIRLERLRAELDDRYEAQNQRLSSIEPEPHDQTEMVEEAMNVDEKSVPAIQPDKPAANLSGVADGKGYEWITQDDGMAWFRIENSDSEWELFEA